VSNNDQAKDLRQRLNTRRQELEDMRKALPAHSLRPNQLMQVEEMEDEIAGLEEELTALEGGGG